MITLTHWQRPGTACWHPSDQTESLRDELDRLFALPAHGWFRDSSGHSDGWIPAMDLCEDKERFLVKAELPGMKKEDIVMSLHDGVLTLSGQRKQDEKAEKTEIHRSERFYGRFERKVSLPAAVDAEKVQATYQDGILTVILPKTEAAKPRTITISEN